MPKTFTIAQQFRKSDALTKGCDARIANLMREVLPIIKRSKKDKLLTRQELKAIDTLRKVLDERLRIAAFDQALRTLQKMPE
jgi:hypothetical protein